MRTVSLIALLFGLALTGGAKAQVFMTPCHVDTLCAGVEKGGGRIVNCLRGHKGELSQQCYAALGHWVINQKGKGQGGQGGGGNQNGGGNQDAAPGGGP